DPLVTGVQTCALPIWVMICGSGFLVAIAWMINAYADSLALLYLGAAIGGIGAGVIYGGSVGNALKWFPDRRGLAAGLTAAGFGADRKSTRLNSSHEWI